jgi:hypothetical protein
MGENRWALHNLSMCRQVLPKHLSNELLVLHDSGRYAKPKREKERGEKERGYLHLTQIFNLSFGTLEQEISGKGGNKIRHEVYAHNFRKHMMLYSGERI